MLGDKWRLAAGLWMHSQSVQRVYRGCALLYFCLAGPFSNRLTALLGPGR